MILLFNNQSIFNMVGNEIGIYSNLSLNDDEKLQLTFANLENRNRFTEVTISKNKISIDFDNKETIKEMIISAGKQIAVSEVENEYYNLFHEKMISYKNYSDCPTYLYDSANSVYYRISECGGAMGGQYPLYYANRYTYKDNEAYVYINLGYIMMKDNELHTYQIYTDLEHQKLYKTVTKDIDIYNSNIINQSNYKDFSEYKYTFVKNDNNGYYFKSIEKTK